MALLDGLDAAFVKCEHDGGAGHSLLLLSLNDIQQLFDLVHFPVGGLQVPFPPDYRWSVRLRRQMGSMVFDVKPMVFPSRKVGGEFVCEIFVAGLLTQWDAGAPHNGQVLGGGLWFDTEEETEKIPVGFDSKKSLAVIDEN
jgi:hypothetical protein